MDRTQHMRALEEQLRRQSQLVEALCRRAAAATDPRLKSAWIGMVVSLMNASAATGSVLADFKWAPRDFSLPFPIRLRPAKLPALPNPEEGGPPAQFPKTTSSGFSNGSNGLAILVTRFAPGRISWPVRWQAEGRLSSGS